MPQVKISHATMKIKDPECLQLRPNAAKKKKKKKRQREDKKVKETNKDTNGG